MGLSNMRIVGMILVQALVVGVIGYSIGVGLTAIFFESTARILTQLVGLHMYWQVMAGSGVAVVVIVMLASLLSIRRVLVTEPAIVFRG
jgi:putative ABC transport system permease protein